MITQARHLLSRLFNRARTQAPLEFLDEADNTVPHYPPPAPGLPPTPVRGLLEAQHDLIVQLKLTLGLTERQYLDLVQPVIERYTAFVHLLPASQHHHRGTGGLLRHGLEVACLAAQTSDAIVWANAETPCLRRDCEPRWRVAVALAGLCHDLGKPIVHFTVRDSSGALSWQPFSGSLIDWANENRIDRYFIDWREYSRDHQLMSISVADQVLTPRVKAWLAAAPLRFFQRCLRL